MKGVQYKNKNQYKINKLKHVQKNEVQTKLKEVQNKLKKYKVN